MPGSLVDGLATCGAIVLVAWILKGVSDMKKKFRKYYLWWKRKEIHGNWQIYYRQMFYGHVLRRHQKQGELKRAFYFSGQILKLQKARLTRNAGARFVAKSKVT